MVYNKNIFILLLAFSLTSCHAPGPEIIPEPAGSQEEWFDNKFSMFIHWGIYSELGGVWNGEPVKRGYSEQIQSHAGIYSDVYGMVADRFDPVKWDPDSVVLLAKNAGMRSVVITSKHHDGFCMFDSDYTDYNVVKATPYGRDVIGELSEACARHGVKLGLYFSLIDWHYPPAYPISSHNADFIPSRHHEYNKNQVRELLTNYGPISEIWFDMGSLEPEQSRELKELVHSLQPDCMVSGRLGNDMGDFTVMGDNEYPDYTLDTPWQTPASMFDETWSYRSWQERGDPSVKVRDKLESLIMVVSRGGNYLLNIGPRGDGSVVDFEKEVLLGIGAWLKANGEAIYGTRPVFSAPHEWGEVTAKGNNLFLHILTPPGNGVVTLKGVEGTLAACRLLDDPGSHLEHTRSDGEINISLGDQQNKNEIQVIVLEFKDGYHIIPQLIAGTPPSGEPVLLDRHNSNKHYSFSGVDYYSSFRSTVRESWTLDRMARGSYRPLIYYSDAERSRSLRIETPSGNKVVRLLGGEQHTLRENFADLKFGVVYVNGPHSSRIDRKTGMENNIDTGQRWPSANGPRWERTAARAGDILKRPVRRNHCWYAYQVIESMKDSELMISMVRTDGVQVFLNGEEIYVHNNPMKKEQMEDILRLSLNQGRNELLVKFYNRFDREMAFSLNHKIPQAEYRMQLEDISFPGTTGQGISWYLDNPVSVHSNMAMPNLRLELHEDL
jgi:alpha-L-fucosidase